jgi:hypothetical protein
VPNGGAGLRLLHASVHGAVSGSVLVARGGIQVSGVTVADIDIWPLGGTNVDDSAAYITPLADGDTISVVTLDRQRHERDDDAYPVLGRPAADGLVRGVSTATTAASSRFGVAMESCGR